MKVLNSLIWFVLGAVAADNIADTLDQKDSLYVPLEGESDLLPEIDDGELIDLDAELTDIPDDVDSLDYPTELYDVSKADKKNRLTCPFTGEGCRFKKAKCVCKSKDASFKFTIKKFKMVNKSPDFEDHHESEEPKYVEQMPEEPRYVDQVPEQPRYVDQMPVDQYGPQEYPALQDQSMVQDDGRGPGAENIINEIPGFVEGFKSVEKLNDPRQVFVDVPEGQGVQQLPGDARSNGFDDKTIRVKTEDNNDKKVHEYEYLRIKNVDDKEVEEKHIETPENSSPEFSYHKGVVPDIDHSVKKGFLESLSKSHNSVSDPSGFPVGTQSAPVAPAVTAANKIQMKLDEVKRRNEQLLREGASRQPISMGYYTTPNVDATSVPMTPADRVQMKLDDVRRRNEQMLTTPPSATPIALPYPNVPVVNQVDGALVNKSTNVTSADIAKEKLEDKLIKKIESANKIQMKLDEVKRRNEQLLREGASRQPISMGYYTTPNVDATSVPMTPADRVQMKLDDVRRRNEQMLTTPPSATPIALPYPNVPVVNQVDGALVNQPTDVAGEGASLRGLKKKSKKSKKSKKTKKNKKNKKSKSKNNEEKMRRKMEKKRRREEKKKAKIAKKNAEKRERERLEEMKERERIIEEKLDEEKEELEESQIAASEKARIAKKLQQQQELQQRKIDQAERNIQLRHQRQKKLEERKRLQRLRREQLLMKQQERDLNDLSTTASDEDEVPKLTADQDDEDDE